MQNRQDHTQFVQGIPQVDNPVYKAAMCALMAAYAASKTGPEVACDEHTFDLVWLAGIPWYSALLTNDVLITTIVVSAVHFRQVVNIFNHPPRACLQQDLAYDYIDLCSGLMFWVFVGPLLPLFLGAQDESLFGQFNPFFNDVIFKRLLRASMPCALMMTRSSLSALLDAVDGVFQKNGASQPYHGISEQDSDVCWALYAAAIVVTHAVACNNVFATVALVNLAMLVTCVSTYNDPIRFMPINQVESTFTYGSIVVSVACWALAFSRVNSWSDELMQGRRVSVVTEQIAQLENESNACRGELDGIKERLAGVRQRLAFFRQPTADTQPCAGHSSAAHANGLFAA